MKSKKKLTRSLSSLVKDIKLVHVLVQQITRLDLLFVGSVGSNIDR
jgi:hypothetical protein